MAAGAKACPSCGAKNKKPIYRRWWFWVLVVLVIAAVGSAMGSEDNGTDATQQIQQETTGTPESGAGQAEEQRQQVLDMQIDQVITVRGQITSVGEVMGYSLDVDDFGA